MNEFIKTDLLSRLINKKTFISITYLNNAFQYDYLHILNSKKNVNIYTYNNTFDYNNIDSYKIPETPKALFEFDGHNTEDVIDRLLSL